MQINNQASSQQNRVADDGGQEAGATVPPGKLSSIKTLFPLFLEKPFAHFFPPGKLSSTKTLLPFLRKNIKPFFLPGALLHQPEVERSEKVGDSGTGSEAGDGLRVSLFCIKT